MVAILACYIGPVEAGEAVVRPLKEFGPPVMDMIRPMPYVQAQSLIDAASPGAVQLLEDRACLRKLSATTRSAPWSGGFREVASPYSSVLIEQLGGACSRVGERGDRLPSP